MPEAVVGMNPDILRWARERAGLSLDDVASRMKKKREDINNWELGDTAPTYVQLEKLAYQVFKRPLALFFFPQPPEERDEHEEFRTLPEFEIENLAADTRLALRQARAMQISLYELNEGQNPFTRKIFADLKLNISAKIESAASNLRQYLGIEPHEQFEWESSEVALGKWRNAVEQNGVYVFKRSMSQSDISGFCLFDTEFPLIYVNNSTAKTRQIFTIFHELAHILLASSGITKLNTSYIDSLAGENKRFEIFCNQFAAEFLTPWNLLKGDLRFDLRDDNQLGDVARKYKVSREVVLRRALEHGLIDSEYYRLKSDQWINEFRNFSEQQKKGGGGNYYATQATYLGENYLRLVFGKYYQGNFGREKLSEYLDMKVQNIPNLEQFLMGRM